MPDRPDPDALLATVAREERRGGRLKIYLGMAAGVGKTYAMLSDGQEERRRGRDAVLGYLEPHGRVETDRQAEGFETLPLLALEHKGVTLREFDLDGALARKPEILLVDELAHTNAPGARHRKRWQDVQELVAAGIEVWTTVNVQHLESLNDVVASVTGVVVAEKVPDEVVDSASEIELVDIPPEDLRQRLKEGKVYVPEKVEGALAGFFKRGNLLALREMALRRTAERVDVEMREARSLSRDATPWHAGERVLVCVAPNRMAPRVVRAARRLASSLHGELLAVAVDSPRQSRSEAGRTEMEEALRLAESLGADTATLAGEDIVAEILRHAQEQNVTTIVLGKPVRPRWKEIVFGSVADTMIRSSGDIDVLVITDREESGTRRAKTRDLLAPTPLRPKGLLLAAASIAAATALGSVALPLLSLVNLAMLYVLASAFVASRAGFRESLLAALAGALAFNFFFVPPRFTFMVADAAYLVTLLTMLVVSVLISSLASRLRASAEVVAERERATAALYDLVRRLNRTGDRDEMARLAVAKAESLLGVPAMVAVPRAGEVPVIAAGSSNAFEAGVQEIAVSAWTLDQGRPAGRHTHTLAGARGSYLPLLGSDGVLGALGIEWDVERPPTTSARHLAEAIAAALAGAFERLRLAQASLEAERRTEGERLRGDLLSSVSHDLRTPLTAIAGSASGLLEGPALGERGEALARNIVAEAGRMNRLVGNLLDMARAESGGPALNLDWQSLEEIVGAAVLHTERLFERPVEIALPPGLPLLRLDATLVEQALVNLLENAARHAGPKARVVVTATVPDPGTVAVTVGDDGPGLPPGEEEAIWTKFRHRSGSGGFGLGLAIVRAVAAAHGGSASARTLSGGGAEFTLAFPIAPPDAPGGGEAHG